MYRSCEFMVAERFIVRGRLFVKIFGEIESENAGMSNDKKCERHFRRKY
jgi:hypothetical protein